MKKSEAIKAFGRASKVADALNISRAAVSCWPDDHEGDIPELRALQIEKILAARAVKQPEPEPQT